VLFVNLDGFRIVDETLGHQAGEQVLVAFARRLLACVRPADTVARIGGHEFGVLIPQVGGTDRLVDLAERILDALDEPSGMDEGPGVGSALSVGLALADPLDMAADELLRRAHVAMHAARVGGKELVGFFEPSRHVVLERRRGAGAPQSHRDTTPGLDGENGVRLWMARELHDDALQTLTTMLIDMEQVRRELPEAAISSRVVGFQASVRSAISGLRRLVGELRNQSGEDHGLVEDLTALLGQLDDRAGVKGQLSVSASWPSSLSTHIASHLRRIAEEALRNVASHSGAQRVLVCLDTEEDRLTLTVSDDGQGCEWFEKASQQGSGLLGMRERALILGGQLEVTSRPGAGTTVRGTFASRSA